MHSPAWMADYAVVLVLLGAAYTALVFIGSGLALVFALAALAAMLVTLAMVFFH